MSKGSALTLAAGVVAAVVAMVVAAVITVGDPAVAEGHRSKAAAVEPRIRTLTRTVTIHKQGDGSAATVQVTGGSAPVSTSTSAVSLMDDETSTVDAEGDDSPGGADDIGLSGHEAGDD